MVKKSELKLDIKLYDISRWGNYLRGDTIQGGDTIDYKKVLTGDTIQGGTLFKGGH